MAGLRNEIRESLLRSGHGWSALIIDKLILESYLPGEWVSARVIYGLLPATWRGGIHQAFVAGILIRREIRTGRPGRPEFEYQVPDQSKLATRQEIEIRHENLTDYLPGWSFRSLRHYRLALYGALIVRRVAQAKDRIKLSRSWISRRLGICKATTRAYDRSLDVVVEADFIDLDLDIKKLSPTRVPGPYFLERGDGVRGPAVQRLAKSWLAEGYQIRLRKQVTSYFGFGQFNAVIGSLAGARWSPLTQRRMMDGFGRMMNEVLDLQDMAGR